MLKATKLSAAKVSLVVGLALGACAQLPAGEPFERTGKSTHPILQKFSIAANWLSVPVPSEDDEAAASAYRFTAQPPQGANAREVEDFYLTELRKIFEQDYTLGETGCDYKFTRLQRDSLARLDPFLRYSVFLGHGSIRELVKQALDANLLVVTGVGANDKMKVRAIALIDLNAKEVSYLLESEPITPTP